MVSLRCVWNVQDLLKENVKSHGTVFFSMFPHNLVDSMQWEYNLYSQQKEISLGVDTCKMEALPLLGGGGPRVVVSTAAFHARVRGSVPGLGGLKETKLFLPHPRLKVSIVGSLRDREVACSVSDRQGSNFESCVWRTVSSQSSHHPQEVLLAQFSLYVHKGGLKPDSFHFFLPLLGIMLLSGYSRSPYSRLYWSEWTDIHNSLVSDSLRQNRFDVIIRDLYFRDNTNLLGDR